MEKRLAEENIPVEVESAGTLGLSGGGPTREVAVLLAKEGIDHKKYRSKGLCKENIDRAGLILVMEPEHKARILELAPYAGEKVLYLGQFNPDPGDVMIPDPIGRPLAFYRASFRLIKNSVEGLIKWIKE